MTENHDRPVLRGDDLQLLLADLACVSGTLSEIMTAWRRAQPGRPELRPGQLVRLQDDARRLAADLEAAVTEGLTLCAADRLAGLAAAAAAVRAVTCAPGGAEAGDRGLWDLLAAAVRRAQARWPALVPGEPGADAAALPRAERDPGVAVPLRGAVPHQPRTRHPLNGSPAQAACWPGGGR